MILTGWKECKVHCRICGISQQYICFDPLCLSCLLLYPSRDYQPAKYVYDVRIPGEVRSGK